MTVGVGDDVAYAAIPEQQRPQTAWGARFRVAFGGAVLAVALILLGSLWSSGLRASTFEQLRGDLRDGSVLEWYVADNVARGDFDVMEANQSTTSQEVSPDGVTARNVNSDVFAGGVIVWRTMGGAGWHVAAADMDLTGSGGFGASATPESTALVKELRAAGVSMRPYYFRDATAIGRLATVGGVLLFIGMVSGSAPRVGTRWFWFWMFLNGPLFLGFIAYAVMELIGFRRRPDPPLKKRLPGIVSFVGAPTLGLLLVLGADYLRSRGVPIPL